jgi:hypothetical protein
MYNIYNIHNIYIHISTCVSSIDIRQTQRLRPHLAVLEAGLPFRLPARDVGEPRELLQQVRRLLLRVGLQVVDAAGVVALLLGDELDGGRDAVDAAGGAGAADLAGGDAGGEGDVARAGGGDLLDVVGAQLLDGEDLGEGHHVAHGFLADKGDAQLILCVDYSPLLPAPGEFTSDEWSVGNEVGECIDASTQRCWSWQSICWS